MAKVNGRTVSAIQTGLFLIAVAVALIVYMITDNAIGALCSLFLVFGLVLCVMSPLRSSKTTGIGAADDVYNLAIGMVIAVVGLIGVLWACTDLGGIVLAAIFLVCIAVIGITVAIINNNREA